MALLLLFVSIFIEKAKNAVKQNLKKGLV